MTRRTWSHAITALFPLFAACASAPEAQRDDNIGDNTGDNIGRTRQPIIAGEESDSSQNSVVLIVALDSNFVGGCTGTLVAPNLVLTARHCVSIPSDGAFGCDSNGNLVPGSEGGRLVSDLDPSQLYVFKGPERPKFGSGNVKRDARGTVIVHNGGKTVCSNDLALIVLDTALDVPIAPIRLDGSVKPGDVLTAVGYGLTESGREASTRLQRNEIPVLRVGPQPGSTAQPPVSPNVFEVGEAICQGDSGGPAFDQRTGAVVGVVSAGGNGKVDEQNAAGSCIGSTTRNYYTSTSAFKEVITEAFKAAGAEPWLEGGFDPRLAKTGTSCTNADECQGGLCLEDDREALVCTQRCEDSLPCPSGFGCVKEGTDRICREGAVGATPGAGGGCSTAGSARTSRGAGWAMGVMIALAALVRGRRRRKF